MRDANNAISILWKLFGDEGGGHHPGRWRADPGWHKERGTIARTGRGAIHAKEGGEGREIR